MSEQSDEQVTHAAPRPWVAARACGREDCDCADVRDANDVWLFSCDFAEARLLVSAVNDVRIRPGQEADQ